MKESPLLTLIGVGTVAAAILSAPCRGATTDPVGYVSYTYQAGYNLIGSGLTMPAPNDQYSSTIANLFSDVTVPVGTVLQTYTTGDFDTYILTDTGWEDESQVPVTSFDLLYQYGAILHLPETTTITFSGQVYIDGINGFDPSPVAAPYSPSIHLLQNSSPIVDAFFEGIVGRAPGEGDAVLQLAPSGATLISRYLGGTWYDPFGGNAAPVITTGAAAFFDLSGNGFDGFQLAPVPEPRVALLFSFVAFAFTLYRKRLPRGTDHAL
jgi:hypothetical protein